MQCHRHLVPDLNSLLKLLIMKLSKRADTHVKIYSSPLVHDGYWSIRQHALPIRFSMAKMASLLRRYFQADIDARMFAAIADDQIADR